jgi:hypothetical protein
MAVDGRFRYGDAALRVDEASGCREVVRFVGPPGSGRFTVTYLPAGEPTAGVLLCPSILADTIPLYRREVALARALSRRGIAVVRFHYRGSGHSAPVEPGPTFESMLQDADVALATLATLASDIGVVGSRFGALVAIRCGTGPLVLWEPVLSGEAFYRQALRARLAKETRAARSGGGSKGLLAELRVAGVLDINGHAISTTLYDSTVDLSLAGECGETARETLLVQLGAAPAGKPLSELVASLSERGWNVCTDHVPTNDVWWFVTERAEPAVGLIERTATWLAPRLQPTVRA